MKKNKLEKSVKNVNSFFREFKSFALKKNIVDLAVAVVVGGAFGKIVTSLVNDIIMPLISMLLKTDDFSNLKLLLRSATENTTAVYLNYGLFIKTLADFFIIALCIFIVIKFMNKAQKALETVMEKIDNKEKPENEEVKPILTKDQELLTEIVTLLKKNEEKSSK